MIGPLFNKENVRALCRGVQRIALSHPEVNRYVFLMFWVSHHLGRTVPQRYSFGGGIDEFHLNRAIEMMESKAEMSFDVRRLVEEELGASQT